MGLWAFLWELSNKLFYLCGLLYKNLYLCNFFYLITKKM